MWKKPHEHERHVVMKAYDGPHCGVSAKTLLWDNSHFVQTWMQALTAEVNFKTGLIDRIFSTLQDAVWEP